MLWGNPLQGSGFRIQGGVALASLRAYTDIEYRPTR